MYLVKDKKNPGISDDESGNSSSDLSSSDEDEEINPEFDHEFLKAMACLKRKHPSMYDKNTRFFDNESNSADDSKDCDHKAGREKKALLANKKSTDKYKDKPITLKDYERQVILEKEGKFEDGK